MSFRLKTVNNVLLTALLFTTAGVTIGFSKSLLRGYVVIRFAFLAMGASLFSSGILFHLLSKTKEINKNKKFFGVLGAQAFALALSVAVSIMPWVSLLGSVPRMMGATTYWACLFTAAATVLAIDERENRFLLVLRLLMLLSVIVSLHALYELPSVKGFRPPGLLGNPDFLGNWLVVIVATGFSLLLSEKKTLPAAVAGIGSALGLVTLIFSQTRGAWLGLAVSIIVLMATLRLHESNYGEVRRRTLYWVVASCIGVLLLLGVYEIWGPDAVKAYSMKTRPNASPAFLKQNLELFGEKSRTGAVLSLLAFLFFLAWTQIYTRWKSLKPLHKKGLFAGVVTALTLTVTFVFATPSGKNFRKKNLRLEFKNEGRRIIWRDTVEGMVPRVWYKGCGIETYRVAFLPSKSIDLAINGPKQNWRNPHNVILYEITSNGILGLLAYLLLIGYTLSRFIKARKEKPDSPFGMIITGCFASFCGYLVHNLVNYDVVATSFSMYLMVGLAQAGWLIRKKKPQDQDAEPQKSAAEEKKREKKKGKRSKKKRSSKSSREKRSARSSSSPNETLSAKKKNLFVIVLNAIRVLCFIPFFYSFFADDISTKWQLWLFGIPASFLAVSLVKEKLAPPISLMRRLVVTAGFAVFWLLNTALIIGPKWLSSPMRRDILPLLLSSVLLTVAVLVTLGSEQLWHKPLSKQADKPRDLVPPTALAIGVLMTLLLIAGAGALTTKHLIADWGLQRAKALSKAVDRKLLPRLDKTKGRIASLKKKLRSAQDKGASPQALRKARRILRNLERNVATQSEELKNLKSKIVHFGRMGTNHFQFMGFFHHQYSKALQPFLRKDGRLPRDEAEKLMMEALFHAKAAVKNNTNPESSYSHLAVMHYWSIRFCSHDPKGMTRRECERVRFEKAKKALKGSMDHDPYYYDTHRMMAFMLTKDKDLDGAIKEIKMAKKIIRNRLRKFPTVAQVDKMIKKQLLIKGVRLAKNRRYEEALAAYKEALNRYGEPMPEAHHQKGVVFMRQKNYAAAETSLKRSIKQNHRYFAARVDLAKLRFFQKRYKEGYRIIRKLLSPRVKSPAALLVRAWALESQGDIQGAVKDLRRFLSVAPNTRKSSKVRRKIKKLISQKR